MAYPLAQIEALKAQLKELPEPDVGNRSVSKQQAIRMLARDIAGLQRKGYTLEQVATLLSERGVEINAATLKSYIRRTKRKRPRGKTGPPGKAAPAAAAAAAEAPRASEKDRGALPPEHRSAAIEASPKHSFTARDDSDDI